MFRDSIEVTAPSVEEAKRRALEILEADDEAGIRFEVLEEGDEVRLKAVRETPDAATPRQSRPAKKGRRTRLRPGSPSRPWPKPEVVIEVSTPPPPVTQMGIAPSKAKEREAYEPTEEHNKAVEDITLDVLEAMELPYEVTFEHGDYQRIFLDVEEDDAGALIGRRGSGVDALELIIGRMINQACHCNVPVQLDVNHYREREHDKLRERALEVAEKVRDEGREFHFEPMNPRDRRVVHLAIEPLEDLTTFTVGEGARRHVVVARVEGD